MCREYLVNINIFFFVDSRLYVFFKYLVKILRGELERKERGVECEKRVFYLKVIFYRKRLIIFFVGFRFIIM